MATDQRAIKVYLPEAEAARIERMAAADDRTLTSMVRIILRQYLKDHPEAGRKR